jgi:hypothetical protein
MNTVLKIPIPESVLTEKRALLAAHGFTFPGNSGKGSFKAIEFDYSYSGGILTLTITKKPALIPMSIVKSKIEQWVGIVPEG